MNRREFFKDIAAAGAAAMFPILSLKVIEPPRGAHATSQRGYKGDSQMDSGYFYVPTSSLPRMPQSPVLMDFDEFCPRKGLMTRYSKKLLREGARYYQKVPLKDLLK